MPSKQIQLSVIVPVFNESANVEALHREIIEALKHTSLRFEVIFVDDGSTDNTFEELKRLKPVKIVRLRSRCGQSCALDAGIKAAQGDILVTIDGDGQNDPAAIVGMIDKLNEGFDVVCGWRHQRKDIFLKRFISGGAAFLRRFFVDDGVHDAGCTLRIYRKECFEDLDLYGELHRMIPSLLKWRGFKVAEIKTNHRPRFSGKTKYNWHRIMNGFLDMIYVWFWRKYSSRPLHLFGALGIIFIAVGMTLLFLLAFLRLFCGYLLSQKIWPLVGFFVTLSGIQMLFTGILAANLVENSRAKKYFIKEVIHNETA